LTSLRPSATWSGVSAGGRPKRTPRCLAASRPALVRLMKTIARELVMRGVKTARGGAWTAQAVKNLLALIGLKT